MMTRRKIPSCHDRPVANPRSLLCGVLLASAVALSLAAPAQAQNVALAGEYGEAAGVIHFPQSDTTDFSCSTAQDARCIVRDQGFFGNPIGQNRDRAAMGVKSGHRILLSHETGTQTPLATGNPVTIPTFQFGRLREEQRRPILNNALVEAVTSITFGLPGADRDKLPPAETRAFARRVFAPTNPIAAGQNNGVPITNPAYEFRRNVNTTFTTTGNAGLEFLTMRYSGGLGFSGTMAALLTGTFEGYIAGPAADNEIPSSLHPGVIRVNAGAASAPFREQHGAGWNYTVTVTQPSGTFKVFPSAPSVIGPPCLATPPPSPAGCNQINGFDTNGIDLGPGAIPGATSTRHMFPWTTGTVLVRRTAIRNGITSTHTITAMGYDTTSPTAMGGNVRRIGLVSGSFAERNGLGGVQLNPSMIGANFELVPEPGTVAALFAGLGLLGALAQRRR